MTKTILNKKIICEVKGAWLITWEFHSPSKRKDLKNFGIDDEIIDILDSHKNFDYVLEYTKNIYKVLIGDYCDKILLAKRGKLKMTEEEFFDSHFFSTCYRRNSVYSKLIKILETKGINSREYKKANEKWKNYPQYISIGHNPSIHARKVRNLKVYKDKYGKEFIKWQEKTIKGDWRDKIYTKYE